MLYYLFQYLDQAYNLPGAGVFQFLSFRAGMTIILSLLITMAFGRFIVRFLQKLQVGETVRNLGLEGQKNKEGTPTMGGLIILLAILLPVLLFARLENVYIILMLLSTVWMGVIGFLDDYIKIFKQNKKGLAGRFKIFAQIGLGVIVGATLFFNEDVVVRKEIDHLGSKSEEEIQQSDAYEITDFNGNVHVQEDVKQPVTTIPFVKNNELNYADILAFVGGNYEKWAFLVYIPIVIFIVMAVSNGANLTDGLDGLATGTSAIIGATLGVFAYVSGNVIFSNYLNIMFIPHSGELVVYSAGFIGACVGFLWYNAYPAQVFMGDTGSLAIGGIIAALAVIVRKELLIPILCGIFLVENLSVMIQVAYFKYTKYRYGEGSRIFLMTPLHHHYQKKSVPEAKIVTRFWIVGILLAVLTVVTLKLR